MKLFYQCDVAEGNDADGSIWTSSVHYCDSMEEAEFLVMLELQQDWGDGYMPDAFIDAFGSESPETDTPLEVQEPVFPGAEAWNAAGYWDDIPAKTGMLTVDTVTALAKLGKIKCDLPSDIIDAALADQAQLHVVVNMRETVDA
jgi:hypothetical protein